MMVRVKGYSLVELMLAMTLSSVVISAGWIMHSNFVRANKQVMDNQYTIADTSYFFYWLNHFSRLSHKAITDVSQHLSLEEVFVDMLMHKVRGSHSQWILFEWHTAEVSSATCEGSILMWMKDKPVYTFARTLIWHVPNKGVKCKTWVKKKDRWCEMPIDNGKCTLSEHYVGVLTDGFKHVNIVSNGAAFEVQISIDNSKQARFDKVFYAKWPLLQKKLPFKLE